MKDFTLDIYKKLIESGLSKGYHFTSFRNYLADPSKHRLQIILRHDVDRLPDNALKMAKIENSYGAEATYYFRTVPSSYNIKIIKQIAELNHEIGYHYETMDTSNGDIDLAYTEFCKNLEKFQEVYPIRTICMHGSPLSRFDNKSIWNKYDYKGIGIIGEPYFDIDYNKVLYLTDTGRRWNNKVSNIRDNVNQSFELEIESTKQIISLIESGGLPASIMINVHPQRWFNFGFCWYKELILQNFKNFLKFLLIRFRKK